MVEFLDCARPKKFPGLGTPMEGWPKALLRRHDIAKSFPALGRALQGQSFAPTAQVP